MSLSNKVVLISGANRGIGAATVQALLAAGVSKVYAGARTISSVPNFGDARVVPIQLDVTNKESVAKAAIDAPDVDVLINNAGTAAFSDFVKSDLDAVDADMQVNYYGTLNAVRAFAPNLIQKGAGTIVNVVSIVGLSAVPILAGYSASKAALQSMTQSLRGSLKGSGITVIGVYPGPVDTELARDIPLAKVTPEEVANNIVAGISNGDEYIFPDAMAKQIEHLWSKDGRNLEAAMRVG